MLIRLTVDGIAREVEARPATSLLHVLRDDARADGVKDACEQGECGSCSVWLDGDVVCSCLVPAVQADGADVRTVESLANGSLHPRAGGVPGRRRRPVRLLHARDGRRRRRPARARPATRATAEVREALAGNLCRCTGYQKIVEAVLLAGRDAS